MLLGPKLCEAFVKRRASQKLHIVSLCFFTEECSNAFCEAFVWESKSTLGTFFSEDFAKVISSQKFHLSLFFFREACVVCEALRWWFG